MIVSLRYRDVTERNVDDVSQLQGLEEVTEYGELVEVFDGCVFVATSWCDDGSGRVLGVPLGDVVECRELVAGDLLELEALE